MKKKLHLNFQKTFIFEVVVVVLVWLRVSWPFLKPGTYVYGFDTLTYTGPATKVVFDSWRQLRVPLWSDQMFGGVPFLGRLGAQALYFPNLPFVFFDLNTALDLSMATHLLLMSVGFLVLVRFGMKLAPPAGALVSITVLTSAFVGVKTLSFDQLVALSWLPWILFCTEKLVRGEKVQANAAGLAISASALILGGHPQFIYLYVGFSSIYILARIVDARNWRLISPFGLSAVLALGMTALQGYSTYSLNSSSVMAAKKSLESLSLPGFVLPVGRTVAGLIGDPFSSSPTGVSGAGEAIAGFGFVAVLLAFIGCIAMWKSGNRILLFALLLTGFISVPLSYGSTSYFFEFFYDYVPGFGSARVPGRLLVFVLISVVLLAGYGIDFLVSTKTPQLTKNAMWIVVVFCGFFGLLAISKKQDFMSLSSKTFFVLGIVLFATLLYQATRRSSSLVLLVYLLVFSLFPAFMSQKYSVARGLQHSVSFDAPKDKITDFLRSQEGLTIALTYDRFDNPEYLVRTYRPNTNILNEVESIDGYDGGMWVQKRWVESMKAVTGGSFNKDLTVRSQISFPLAAPILARLGVRWAVVETEVATAESQLKGWEGPIMTESSVELWKNPNWNGVATIYARSVTPKTTEDRYNYLTDPSSLSIAVAEPDGPYLSCTSKCIVQQPYFPKVSGIRKSFETLNSSETLVAIHESWSRDWQVYVNGVEAKYFPINVNQIGVMLPGGHNVVAYQYMPKWYQPLMILMIMSTLLTVCLLIAGIRRSAKI